MKKLQAYWIGFAASVLLLLCAWLWENHLQRHNYESEAALHESQIAILNNSEKDIEKLLADTALNNPERLKGFDPKVREAYNEKHLGILAYTYDSLVYWSDNKLSVDSCLGDIRMGSSIMKTQNGYYQVYKQVSGLYTFLCFYLIKQEFSAQNEFLNNQLNADFKIYDNVEIELKPKAGFTDIINEKGQYLFSERLSKTYKTPLYLFVLILLSVLLTIVSFEALVRKYNRRQKSLWMTLLLCNLIITLRLITLIYHFPQFLYDKALLNAGLYASNQFFASLGDYFINLFFIGRCLYLIYANQNLSTFRHRASKFQWVALIVLFLAVYAAFAGIQSLVIDSRIAFDVNNQSLSWSTILSLAAMFITVLCVLICFRIYLKLFESLWVRQYSKLLWPLLAAGMLAGILAPFHWAVVPFGLMYLLGLMLICKYFRWKNPLQETLAQVALSALFVSILIGQSNYKKENDLRKLVAENTIDQSDRKAEKLLQQVDKKVSNEFLAYKFFESPLVSKKMLEKRLREEYFNGYMNRYEMLLLDYDAHGGFFKEKSFMSFSGIDSIHSRQATPLSNSHFSRINVPGDIGGYLGKYRFYEKENEGGYLYILLQPRSFQNENSFNEILSERRKPFSSYAYSWAIYKGSHLFNSRGNYSFPLYFNELHQSRDFVYFQENGFSHLAYNPQAGLSVQVSLEYKPISTFVITATFLFTYFLLLVFLLLFLSRLLIVVQHLPLLFRSREWFENAVSKAVVGDKLVGGMNLSLLATRIQFALGFMVFFTLIVTVAISQQSAKQAYNQRQVDKLLSKARDITSSMEGSIEYSESGVDVNQLKGLVDRLSESTNTDINLFDASGNLIKTTQPKIFESGIISPKLHPDALYNLRHQEASQYIQNENIGKLQYVSAYLPLLERNEKIGYINVPFFSKQAELEAELKANLISLTGPYSLLFVLVGILAWLISSRFTSRLSIIREYLGRTDFFQQNNKIRWTSKDEIGELVKQYNLMLDKLAESADMLAKTERDQAWREMAKQIAHEIKNPLTPMKLNIQLLQKTWDDKSPNMDAAIRKTSSLLVEQIDALAQLATSFSNFAQMPESHAVRVDVSESIQNAAALFEEEATISFAGFEKKIYILVDKDEWKRVLNNLLKNAIQAAPEGIKPTIRISIEPHENKVLISISDNGTGIPEEIQDKVYEPNFSTKNSGMGLGLAMVKKIMDHANGKIWFETNSSSGTTFYLEFRIP